MIVLFDIFLTLVLFSFLFLCESALLFLLAQDLKRFFEGYIIRVFRSFYRAEVAVADDLGTESSDRDFDFLACRRVRAKYARQAQVSKRIGHGDL